MVDVFSLRRFGLLFKKNIFERPVQFGGLVALILVITLILYAIVKTIVGFEEAQFFTFMLGLIGGGSFLASFVFGYFSSYASGSSFLTMPASHLEKWLCSIIIVLVLFPVIFLGFFKLMDLSFVALYHNSLNRNGPFYKEMFDAVNAFPLTGFVAQKSYISFVNFSAAMVVGSLYFNKVSFIKVALIICALFIGAYFLDYLMAKAVFGTIDRALPFYCVFIAVGSDFGKVMLPSTASKIVDLCTNYIVPGILWLAAYVRLTEKEL